MNDEWWEMTEWLVYFNANVFIFFTVIYFLTILRGKYLRHVFLGGGRFCMLYFAKILGLHVRKTCACGYRYIPEHPRKICGYGYGYEWEILYPWQSANRETKQRHKFLWCWTLNRYEMASTLSVSRYCAMRCCITPRYGHPLTSSSMCKTKTKLIWWNAKLLIGAATRWLNDESSFLYVGSNCMFQIEFWSKIFTSLGVMDFI